MNDFRTLLQQILDTINYQDDKNAFINRFLKNIQLQSVVDLIKSLPQEKQNEIEQQLKEAQDPETAKTVLNQNFSEQQIQDSLKNATQEALTKYIEAINPTLTENQRTKILEIFQKLNPQTSG